MEKEFVSYEQAVALRELGFDEPCLRMSEHRKICKEQAKPSGCQLHNLHCVYPDCTIDKSITPVPLLLKSQAFRWFREKYGLFHDVYPIAITAADKSGSRYKWDVYNYSFIEGDSEIIGYLTYEEAENACIDKLLELAKQQDK